MAAYSEQSVLSQEGKTFLITGANTGIGYETARVLAGQGGRILLGCRDETKAEQAMARIHALHPAAQLRWVPLDLASLASIREAAADIAQESKLDVLINNAGVMVPPYTLTEDGFELQFGVNHLGHFALTNLLLDQLNESPGARVVNVSSLAHLQGSIDFDDLQAAQHYQAMARYRMSKLANMYFTFELARRLQSANAATVSCACHPGIAASELGRHFPKWVVLLTPILWPLTNSAAAGALPSLMAATADGVESCAYFGPQKRAETAGSAGPAKIGKQVGDQAVAQRLWSISAELTGLSNIA